MSKKRPAKIPAVHAVTYVLVAAALVAIVLAITIGIHSGGYSPNQCNAKQVRTGKCS